MNEFLSEQKQNLAPATFNMNSLLKEMQEIEDVRMREAPQRGGHKLPQWKCFIYLLLLTLKLYVLHNFRHAIGYVI